MSTCRHICFSRWSHHVHNRSTVWDRVGQQTSHDLIRFCDECCVAGHFLLLFLVQRHALVFVQVWRKREPPKHISAHERQVNSTNKVSSCAKKKKMNIDHAEHRSMVECVNIIETRVALLCVPRLKWIVLRENCLAHRDPFKSQGGRDSTGRLVWESHAVPFGSSARTRTLVVWRVPSMTLKGSHGGSSCLCFFSRPCK